MVVGTVVMRAFVYNQRMSETKNNHYVPRFYLKSFLDDDGKIWKLDKTNKEIYHPDKLNAECSKKNLYTVNDKISSQDVMFVAKLFDIENNNMYMSTLTHLVHFLNDEVGNLYSIKSKKYPEVIQKIDRVLEAKINNTEYSRTQEIIITELFENRFLPIYENIIREESIIFIEQDVKESIALYNCLNITYFVCCYLNKKIKSLGVDGVKDLKREIIAPIPYYDLLSYIMLQYFRTKSVIEKIKNTSNNENIQNYFNVNSKNFSFLFMYLGMVNTLRNCIYEDSNSKIVLIKNGSNVDFIVSDTPCINIYSSFVKNRQLEDDELELFFPLSPKLAILFTGKTCYKDTDTILQLKDKDIDTFNLAILNLAERYAYANTQDVLKRYI